MAACGPPLPSVPFNVREMRNAPLDLLKGFASAAEFAESLGLSEGWQARLGRWGGSSVLICAPDGTCYGSLEAVAAAAKHVA